MASPIMRGSGERPNPSSLSSALRLPHHRRAQSELAFRFSDDIGPFSSASSIAVDEISAEASEDDLFSTYMDMEKIGCKLEDDGVVEGAPIASLTADDKKDGGGDPVSAAATTADSRPRHRHSVSVDGSTVAATGVFADVAEAKKAMDAEKLAELAELAILDPKRVKRNVILMVSCQKANAFVAIRTRLTVGVGGCILDKTDVFSISRILANRQSAARSKERKTRYISELERKVQTLQTEATTLSAQFTLFQRDTTGLNNENTELKLRLQVMELQAHLRDALNDALMQEVNRLRISTGEIINPGEPFNLSMQNMPSYNPSFFSYTQHPFHNQLNLPPNICNQLLLSQSHTLSEMMQQDPLSQMQGLNISNRDPHLVKSEGSSISASESSRTF
ncbi:Transcription factor RF2b [Acorus calamus]|uniref:Transcription factor RF2b n=1 Tax=Acorus calamus TaxID=4465 RepID=A0AAV9C9R8_ACOCL|nr:Transcription factor RF2b [Acorus calamus]